MKNKNLLFLSNCNNKSNVNISIEFAANKKLFSIEMYTQIFAVETEFCLRNNIRDGRCACNIRKKEEKESNSIVLLYVVTWKVQKSKEQNKNRCRLTNLSQLHRKPLIIYKNNISISSSININNICITL